MIKKKNFDLTLIPSSDVFKIVDSFSLLNHLTVFSFNHAEVSEIARVPQTNSDVFIKPLLNAWSSAMSCYLCLFAAASCPLPSLEYRVIQAKRLEFLPLVSGFARNHCP